MRVSHPSRLMVEVFLVDKVPCCIVCLVVLLGGGERPLLGSVTAFLPVAVSHPTVGPGGRQRPEQDTQTH